MNLRWLSLNRLIGLFVIILTAAAFQKFLIGHYNNYLMFARPFACLVNHQSMYVLHPELYDDLYKYSPVFAWLMAPFYYMPDWLGVLLWNLLNAAGLVVGIWYYLADESDAISQRWTALLIIILEALITAQNMQSNNLIAHEAGLGGCFTVYAMFILQVLRGWGSGVFSVLSKETSIPGGDGCLHNSAGLFAPHGHFGSGTHGRVSGLV